MLYICVMGVMDVVFVCFVTRGAKKIVYGTCECFVMHLVYVCLVCIMWQFSILHSVCNSHRDPLFINFKILPLTKLLI